MIDALINWSLRNRGGVIALAILLLGIGAYTAAKMPVDVFPDLTAPTVTVITEAHGMAPAIPVVEIADDADSLGVGRPHAEVDPADTVALDDVGAQPLIDVQMGTLGHQMGVQIGQKG